MSLSEDEQKLLIELEQRLMAVDPALDRLLSFTDRRSAGRRRVVGILLAIAGVIVSLTGVGKQLLAVGILGFLLMGAKCSWAMTRAKTDSLKR